MAPIKHLACICIIVRCTQHFCRSPNVITSPNYGSTYDLAHGWLIWGNSGRSNIALKYTKDGQNFGTFPVPPWVTGVQGQCIQSLDNGGDIFMAGSPSAYIFHNADSTWERQTDVPLPNSDWGYGGYAFGYGIQGGGE